MKRTFEEIKKIVSQIDCQVFDRDLLIRCDKHPGSDRWFVQVGSNRKCMYTGEFGTGWGGKAEVSPYSTHDEIVKKVLGLCLAYVEHETREGFLFKNKRVFNPHVTIEALSEICDQTMCRADENK